VEQDEEWQTDCRYIDMGTAKSEEDVRKAS
jgi:hypothetical protein